ncbi:DNA-processing protein DprA [Streptomyces hygroscopicus]|uniref:DNA-processing protein DprA n=1 Tax=Streptomyces hygroscopicus TaxID=1912 RepID=UPI00202F60F1|nr:DNA-processing protein DprA [Streptomyces hygroscopicus]
MTTYDTEWIMNRAVTITGTRSTAHRDLASYAELFANYLGPFVAASTHFYIGGAKGIDSLSLLWLAGNTKARITVVVPGTVQQQPAAAQQAIIRSRSRITEVIELRAEQLHTPAFHARNRWMVDHSDMVIGFPLTGPHGTSGTWQTLDYAAQQVKPHLIVPV